MYNESVSEDWAGFLRVYNDGGMRRAIILLAVFVLTCGRTCALPDVHVDTWMSVHIGSARVGYRHISMMPDKLDGRQVCRFSEVLSVGVVRDGALRSTTISQTLYLDDAFRPIQGAAEKTDDGVVIRAEARFLADRIESTVVAADGKTTTATIPIPAGADFSILPGYLAGRITPDTEKSIAAWSVDFFKPALIRSELRADSRKQVIWKGTKRGVLVVRRRENEEEMIDWRLDSGQIIRTELPRLNTIMTATTRTDALAALSGQDLGRVEADRPLSDPRRRCDLSLRLTGFPDGTMALSDSRQTAVYRSKDRSVSYVIHAATFDPAKSAKIPIVGDGYNAYLVPTRGIEADDPDIVKQARSIVANEKNAFRAACKLREWVWKNVRPSPSAPGTPSAVTALRQRAGECRHKAVLYAAMARAAGIPTRLAAGLIYDRGAFVFHVWAESWVGQWVALDPTYPGDFVDATHVKLVQGEVDDLYAVTRVIGRLQAEITP